MRTLFFVLIVMSAASYIYAEDDFLSNTISSINSKLDQYTSGEKGLMSENAKGADIGTEYDRDSIGSRFSEPLPRSGGGVRENQI